LGINKRIGIILAAGLGQRMGGQKENNTAKPLLIVNEYELLIRTILSHEIACCKEAVIVLGWKADEIKKYINKNYRGNIKLSFVYNKNYRLKNGVSLLCTKPFVRDEFLLTMADHILDEGILKITKDRIPLKDGAALCVDYKLETIFDMNDATKVLTSGKLIKRIGKDLDEYNCIDTGVFIGTQGLMEALDQVYHQNGDVSLSEGVQVLADLGNMEAIDIGDCYWQDVDTPEMLIHAEKILKEKQKN